MVVKYRFHWTALLSFYIMQISSYQKSPIFNDLLSHKISQYSIKLLKPTGHVMHQQFNIQQLYVLPTLYLCVLYLSENKQRLVPLTA
jgi:hypothetical protein